MTISIYLLTTAVLILISIFSSKLSLKYGIPALLIFLAIGMIFGSDGLNVVYFEDYQLAQSLGIVALIYILFSGGKFFVPKGSTVIQNNDKLLILSDKKDVAEIRRLLKQEKKKT